MTDVVGAFFRGEKVEGVADEVPEGIDSSGLSLPQQLFEFGEGHLDRIEIRAVGRQEQEARAGVGDEALRLIADAGACLLFLPPYSPDLNPIEMAFAKFKELLRQAQARTVDALWDFIGHTLNLFTPEECANYVRHCGYNPL